ncbi:MAG TPA: TonB family protein [Burkholderiales bacterium]|nr:TonB family protein [Burkholderiales bacterium]
MAAAQALGGNLRSSFASSVAHFWQGLDDQQRLLTACVGASVVLHALLLTLHFRFPETLRWKSDSHPLEVVLVNARTAEKPQKAEVKAQANSDGGGNVDERRRAKAPLPATPVRSPGRDLAEARRRVEQLEAQQRQLLAQSAASATSVAREEPKTPAPAEAQPSGRDLADLSLAAMRLQAQIDKRVEEYQKRPRKRFIGARAAEYRFALYEEGWRAKVERVGTLNYPAEARGKLYGNLRLTVTLRPDGSIERVELDRSSGLKVLDEAALRILQMASPFAAFPPEIVKDTDLLVITRTWFFAQGDKIWTE